MEPEVCTILFVEAVELLTEGEQEHNNNTSLSLSAGQTELPHCPVCLERLDHHISGVLTTVCNHTFHCTCLSQWADTSCPVCRYILAPPATSHCQVPSTPPPPFPPAASRTGTQLIITSGLSSAGSTVSTGDTRAPRGPSSSSGVSFSRSSLTLLSRALSLSSAHCIARGVFRAHGDCTP